MALFNRQDLVTSIREISCLNEQKFGCKQKEVGNGAMTYLKQGRDETVLILPDAMNELKFRESRA